MTTCVAHPSPSQFIFVIASRTQLNSTSGFCPCILVNCSNSQPNSQLKWFSFFFSHFLYEIVILNIIKIWSIIKDECHSIIELKIKLNSSVMWCYVMFTLYEHFPHQSLNWKELYWLDEGGWVGIEISSLFSAVCASSAVYLKRGWRWWWVTGRSRLPACQILFHIISKFTIKFNYVFHIFLLFPILWFRIFISAQNSIVIVHIYHYFMKLLTTMRTRATGRTRTSTTVLAKPLLSGCLVHWFVWADVCVIVWQGIYVTEEKNS